MNKNIWLAASAAALMIALAGCMPADSEGFQNPFAAQKDPSDQETEQATLTVYLEGERLDVAAEVYQGSGYTITVPVDWERSEGEAEWSPYNNDDVELKVRFYAEKKAEEVADKFRLDEDDYVFEGPLTVMGEGSGTLQGALLLRGTEADAEGDEHLSAYFIETEKGCYGLILECPAEALEGYGMYLGAMANSFTLTTAETK